MKIITMLAMLLIIGAATFCQQTNPSPALTKQDYLKKSKNQKTAAWILLGGGSALVVTGILLSNNASFDNLGTTAGVAIVGGLSMLGSIPLFLASGRNKRKAMTASTFFKIETVPVIQHASFARKSYPALSVKINL
jgi:uncharacterized membrane protein